jgi:hypothetical protein
MAETGKPWQGFPFTTIAEVAEEVFLSCVKCKLGNGKRLKFWRDRWLDRKGVEQLAPSLMAFVRAAAKSLTVAEALHVNRWIIEIR